MNTINTIRIYEIILKKGEKISYLLTPCKDTTMMYVNSVDEYVLPNNYTVANSSLGPIVHDPKGRLTTLYTHHNLPAIKVGKDVQILKILLNNGKYSLPIYSINKEREVFWEYDSIGNVTRSTVFHHDWLYV